MPSNVSDGFFIWEGLAFGAECAAYIWTIFAVASAAANEKFKKSLGEWIQNKEVGRLLERWPDKFSQLFDWSFGSNFLSISFILKSCLASCFAVGFMIIIWSEIQPSEFHFAFDNLSIFKFLSGFIIWAIIWNFIPDYISLVQSRYFIKLMSRVNNALIVFLLLIADLVFTPLIFIAYAGVILPLIIGDLDFSALNEIIRFGTQMKIGGFPLNTFDDIDITFGIYLYSTFFTTIWAWFFALAVGGVRLVKGLQIGSQALDFFLDLEKKPILAIGSIAALYAFLVGFFAELII